MALASVSVSSVGRAPTVVRRTAKGAPLSLPAGRAKMNTGVSPATLPVMA
jgi:hypothetical protein